MAEEKRRFSRITFRMKVKLTTEGGEYQVDEIIDLSIGGCQLRVSQEVPVGSNCRLHITLNPADSSTDVEVDGKIVRTDGENIGVKFTGIKPESLEHLQNIIRYNSPDPDKIEEEIDKRPGLI